MLIRTVDYHTAGEPFRIVTEGTPPIEGRTVLDRREAAMAGPADRVRALLVNEPRGHADMYGCFLTPANVTPANVTPANVTPANEAPPDDAGAVAGVLFWHKDGFSTACGHGTIALGTYAVDAGLVDAPADGSVKVAFDVPSGRVVARVERANGRTRSVAFRNVPAYPLTRGVSVTTSRGRVTADLAYGGAMYASVPAASLGLSVTPTDLPHLIAIGREIRDTLNQTDLARHPTDPRLSGVYGTIWYDEVAPRHQRNCTVFADGEVDRSPCGSGTSARLALLYADGRLPRGAILVHESIIGTTFQASVVDEVSDVERPAVLTEIRGSAYRTGEHTFTLDPDDPLGVGFQLR